MISREQFDLYQVGIFEKLRCDEKAFRTCIAANYVRIARSYDCEINISASRLGDTYVYWLSDLERVLGADTDDRTIVLDHFKQASFLSFWLRRHLPLGHVFYNPKPDEPKLAQDKQKYFAFYGNEICALRVGLELCHAYELKRLFSIIESMPEDRVPELKSKRQMLINSELIEPDFEVDFVSTLKHKNNSPHSINLIFRSLFMRYRSLGRQR